MTTSSRPDPPPTSRYSDTLYFGDAPDSIVLEFDSTAQEDDGTLFKFNTSYDFTDDVMAYFTYSEGFRLGAGNGGRFVSGSPSR